MNTVAALSLVKARLGISNSTIRDEYILAIISGVIAEMKDVHGLTLSEEKANQLMFIVDLSTWRYQNRDSPNGLPRHFQWRFHNLLISGGGANSV
ncbi:hypothetical protein FZC76_06860 [Sutcliffiella horikoshii]|uniref:Phage gp6-like head-tail connector protein n=1 Tax=Sutcliffiella horikoshii TaxID=79883 RepID=A0A5D4SZ00_9BACI|nr:hypothetical protein [Sutcliffiella horikoshii]TYS68660.1 hypothetical protein FZC76_06860 [Sutcliffiella horikoshii]